MKRKEKNREKLSVTTVQYCTWCASYYYFCRCLYNMLPFEKQLKLFIFVLVCAEAYNPDEEEDDTESRVCNSMGEMLTSQFSDIRNKKNKKKSLMTVVMDPM